VDHYIEEQTKTNGLLIEWLEDFKSLFSDFEEATATVNQVEEGLQLYKSVVGASKAKINLQKAIKARSTEGSVLEYGLDFHLSRFVADVSTLLFSCFLFLILPLHPSLLSYYFCVLSLQLNKGIPTDKRFIDDYLEEQTRVNGLLITWLEDFRSQFEDMVEAQEVMKRVEDALKLYKTNILASRIKVSVQKARDAKRTEGSVLEFGLEYHLSRFVASLRQGIPQDKSKAGEYVDSLTTVNGLLVQWLEDFKARFGEYEESKATIYEVEAALKKYNKIIGGAKLAAELRAAIENRTICEYGVEWHLKKFNDQLANSMPTAVKEAQEWAHELSRTQMLLVRWLKDFRAKFAYVDEAKDIFSRVEDSLKNFKFVFGKSVVPLAVQQARNARTEDGSILEYGLEFHLHRFTNVVSIRKGCDVGLGMNLN
jgi:hypothetical protein